MAGRAVPILRADWERLAQQRVSHWWRACEQALGKPIGPEPSVELSTRLRTTAGLAMPARRHIKLSFHMFRHEGLDRFDSTIAHEVAHVACDLHHRRSCHHDHRWQRLMRQLGLPAERCHDYGSVQRKPGTELVCPGCTRRVRLGPVQWKRFTLAQARFQCTACNTELGRSAVDPLVSGSAKQVEYSSLHAATQRALQLWNTWIDRAAGR
jgi:predicted SprT family Zn-dependent metalloprotease